MFSNFLYFLIALIVYTTAGLFDDAKAFEGGVILDSIALNMFFILICRYLFHRLEKKLDQYGFSAVDHLVNTYISRLSALALVLFTIHIYGLRLHLYLKDIEIFSLLPTLGAVFFLGLFLLYLVIIWDAAFKVQKHYFAGAVSKKNFILSNVSFSLPALLPWFCLSIVADILSLIHWAPLEKILSSPFGELGYIALFIIAIAVFGPVLIKKLWRCRPLEEGEARKKIQEICSEAGLKFSDILLWELFGGNMITAGVMGIVGRYRYILVTPALLNSLDPEEIKAVILHEIGHVQRHHMLFYLMFFAGFIACSFVFFEPVMLLLIIMPGYSVFDFFGIDRGLAHSILISITLVGMFVVYFRFVFGYFMRNFERQADLHAFEFKKDASSLISTFYKIASFSRQSMEKPNWHHFSIGQRIRFLQQCQLSPQVAEHHHQKVKKLVAGYAVVVLVLFGLGYSINYGHAKEAFRGFVKAKISNQMMDLHSENSDLYVLVGDYYYSRTDYAKAIESYENVLLVDPANVHALNNLSWLYSTCPDETFIDPGKALEYARKALAIKREAFVLDTYAEALFLNNDVVQAIEIAKEALALAKNKKEYYGEQVRRFEQRLKKEKSDANG